MSKWYLAQGGLELGALGLVGVAVLMVSALLTAGYLLPIITQAFFPGADFDYGKLEKQPSSWLMRAPVLLLGIGVTVLGIFPGLLEPLTAPIVAVLFP